MAGGLKGMDGQQGTQDAVGFDPRKIIIEPGFNPRPPDEVKANVDRIKPLLVAAGGVIQPVLLRKEGDQVILVAGETRVRAMRELIEEGAFKDETLRDGSVKMVTIPALYRRAATDERQRLLDALFENEGQPITDWARGAAYARLMDLQWDEHQIAAKVGRSLQHVTSCLKLTEAPMEAKVLVTEGKVTKGAVLSAIKHGKVKELTAKASASPDKVKREKSSSELQKAVASVVREAQDELSSYAGVGVGDEYPEYLSISMKSLQRLIATAGKA